MALVVDGQGAPLVAHRPVVHKRHEGAGYQLADPAGEDGDGLGDVVGLEPVTAGLMEQHSPAART